MASFTKRGDKILVRIRINGYSLQSKTFHTRKDAITWAKSVEADIQMGRWVDPKREGMTFAQALARFKKEGLARVRLEQSITAYVPRLEQVPFLGNRLIDINSEDISLLRDMWSRELKPGSVLRYLNVLSSLFEMARIDWGVNLTNPVKLIRKPKDSPTVGRKLLKGEFEGVLSILDNVQLIQVAKVAAQTGMRLGEVTSLDWRNIDLDKALCVLPVTKNGYKRIVPISREMVKLLESIGPAIEGAVFTIDKNVCSHLWSNAVRKARRKYEQECEREGVCADSQFLVGLRFHDLRHNRVSELHELGLNTAEVAAISGHRSLTCLQRYTHINPEILGQKLAALEAA